MAKKPIDINLYRKRSYRSLFSLILALVAIIGLLKVSVGSIFNFPIAFLFGDGFVVFFALLIVYAFFLLVSPRPKVFARPAAVIISFVSLFLVSVVFLASVNRGFDVSYSWSDWSANLQTFLVSAKTNITFKFKDAPYFDSYAGIFGETVFILLSPVLGKVGMLVTGIVLVLLSLLYLLWPQLTALIKFIKLKIRHHKIRKSVLEKAAKLDGINDNAEEVVPLDTTKVTSTFPVTDEKSNFEHASETLVIAPSITQKTSKPSASLKKELFDEFESLEIEATLEPVIDLTKEVEPVVSEESDNLDELSRVLNTEVNDLEPIITPVVNENVEEEVIQEEESNPLGHIRPVFAQEETVNDTREAGFEVEEEGEVEVEVEEVNPASYGAEPIKSEENSKPRYVHSYKNYVGPPLDLLSDKESEEEENINKERAEANTSIINQIFNDFEVGARVISYTIGPSITRYDIQTDANVSVTEVGKLLADVAVRLGGVQTRFEQVVTGKTTSGLEVANERRTVVNFKECLEALPKGDKMKLHIPFGKNVSGKIMSGSFAEFPHLLVAGSTGSGKSIFIHTVLMSLIMRNSPDELRLLIIDPKRVELSKYNNIPHLLAPIIKDAREAKVALLRLAEVMDERYDIFEEEGAVDLKEYNAFMKAQGKEGMPSIIVVVDEYADLFESEKLIEVPILRLAQKSRSAGIYLLIATQRPSVNVITGVIKANLPSRVAFMTSSTVDSQTIIGQGGAEQLLGNGDMLAESRSLAHKGLVRLQAPFVDGFDVLKVMNYLKTNYKPMFDPRFTDLSEKIVVPGEKVLVDDPLYASVVEYIRTQDRISNTKICNTFNITYPRAKNIYDKLIADNYIVITDNPNSSRGALVAHQNLPKEK